MESERYQVIPRKRGQSLYTILITLLYVIGFALIFLLDGVNITYLLIGLLIVGFGFSFLENFLWRRSWQNLGNQAGLDKDDNTPGDLIKAPDLSGNYRGYPIKLSSFTVGFGRYRKHYTKIDLELPGDIEADFMLAKKKFMQENAALTGNEEFDQQFVLSTSQAWVKNRLFNNHQIEDGLYDILKQARYWQLSATGNLLSFQERGRIKDAEYLQALMDYMIKLAVIIRQNS